MDKRENKKLDKAKVGIGLAGAAAGAAFGAAAATYLSKKENRTKMTEALSTMKEQAMNSADKLSKQYTETMKMKGGRSVKKATPSKSKSTKAEK